MTSSKAPDQKFLTVRFWGVRGSIPSPGEATNRIGGNTSCVEVRLGDEILILDAGTGIRRLGQALQLEFGPAALQIPILITHTHWDHIQGFPFFAPAYQSNNEILFHGYESSRRGFEAALSQQMESPFFPVPMKRIPSSIQFSPIRNNHFRIGSFAIQAARSNHPGVCLAYRVEVGDASVVYMPDHETLGNAFLEEETPTEVRKRIIAFLQNADLAICDAQYTAGEYPAHRGWGHSTIDQTVALMGEAAVRHLCFFHHDPDHDDSRVEEMEMHARKLVRQMSSPMRVEAARESSVVQLPI